MIVIKWKKDESKDEPVYNLFVYTDNNYKMLIAQIGWATLENCWYMCYNIPRIKDKCKKYEQYDKTELNDVLFRAILDIQSDLSFINNMCVEYCNAISDYTIDYIMGVDHNEN